MKSKRLRKKRKNEKQQFVREDCTIHFFTFFFFTLQHIGGRQFSINNNSKVKIRYIDTNTNHELSFKIVDRIK